VKPTTLTMLSRNLRDHDTKHSSHSTYIMTPCRWNFYGRQIVQSTCAFYIPE